MTTPELLAALEEMRGVMILVATGGTRIDDVDPYYQRLFIELSGEFDRRHIENPIPFRSLWDWYGRWSSGDLPTYQSRRLFIGELINPLSERVRTGKVAVSTDTGWPRVDRTVGEIRDRLAAASLEEQFQAIGLLCREALISIAQAVYDPERHSSIDGVKPSATDGKRMLESFIAAELSGGANEEIRRHAKSALDLANTLQHRRTADFRLAALCVEATTSVINVIAIVAGRRDPLQ